LTVASPTPTARVSGQLEERSKLISDVANTDRDSTLCFDMLIGGKKLSYNAKFTTKLVLTNKCSRRQYCILHLTLILHTIWHWVINQLLLSLVEIIIVKAS
jgi:hypothetical protein